MKSLSLFLLSLGVASAFIGTILKEQANIYTKILQIEYKKTKIDVDGLKKLMQVFDSDSHCNEDCEKYLSSIVGNEPTTNMYDFFEELFVKIYGEELANIYDPYKPQEVHLSLTPLPTAMKVMWVTWGELGKPFAQYQLLSDSNGDDWTTATIVTAINYTYTVPQYWWPIFNGQIFETDMTDLIPSEQYRYRVGGYDYVNATTRYSDEFIFKAAPLSTNPNRKTTIATAADHGTFELFGFATVNKMVQVKDELNIELVHVAGDLSYAGIDSNMPYLNITKDDEFEHIWDLLAIQNQPMSAIMPWMVSNGNHEAFYNWTAFSNRFKMPQNDLGSTGGFWYSYDFGNIHILSMSSEHDLSEGSPQMNFAIADLEKATSNRDIVPWIVLMFHKPIYCSCDGGPRFQAQMEPLLLKYDVDLTITGHMHVYERIHPVNNGEITVYPTKKRTEEGRIDVYQSQGKGPVHVVQGNAGGMQFESWQQPQPDWSAIRMANGFIPRNKTDIQMKEINIDPLGGDKLPFNYTNTYGFGVATAINATHMYYYSIPITDSAVGEDKFWIVKRE